MAEKLLNAKEAAARFGISIRTFHRYRAKLIARGMQMVRAGRRVVFRESSIDRVIAWAAEEDEPLYEPRRRVNGGEIAAAKTEGPRNDYGGMEGGGDE